MPGAFNGENTALEVGWNTSPLKDYITAAVCHRNLLIQLHVERQRRVVVSFLKKQHNMLEGPSLEPLVRQIPAY